MLIDLNDEKSKKIAHVLGNKTCKKIIEFLAETKEASEKDISDNLNLPINTIEYNLKKLIESDLIEKTKNFFWSKKGKKIMMYRLSNKSIIISPGSKKISSELKSILPTVILSGIGALAIRQYFLFKQRIPAGENILFSVAEDASLKSAEIMQNSGETLLTMQAPIWIWFFAGALFALFVFSIFKLVKGGEK